MPNRETRQCRTAAYSGRLPVKDPASGQNGFIPYHDNVTIYMNQAIGE
jgi:hypothetical protein